MSIQSQLNNSAISMLPLVSKAIKSAKNPIYSNMNEYALRQINNSTPCLDDMSDEQITRFDADIIETFRDKEWI